MDEPILPVDQIQGHVLPGFKNDHQFYLFYKIINLDLVQKWLASLAPHLSTTRDVLAVNRLFGRMRQRLGEDPKTVKAVWLNLALSASGLRQLASPSDVAQFDSSFVNGMATSSAGLQDPTAPDALGSIVNWVIGGKKNPVDIVLILAGDDPDMLATAERAYDTAARANGLAAVRTERGQVREGTNAGHEHFGFKDGISFPAPRGRRSDLPAEFISPRVVPAGAEFDDYRKDFAGPGQTLVWPGHFIFGYGRQMDHDPRTVDNENLAPGPAWASNGSLMVFRRLNQDVAGFQNYLNTKSAELQAKYPDAGFTVAKLGALLVGRWPSGTPLMRSPNDDTGVVGTAANYFGFWNAPPGPWPGDTAPLSGADHDGQTCPLSAHIRKVNPRDDAQTDIGGAARLPHRTILRRGIPFGISYDPLVPESDSQERGLLFVCFQTDISEQFEFLMQNWVNRPDRPRAASGQDPLIGQINAPRTFDLNIGGTIEPILLPTEFITPTGGEYFFMPSINFFRLTLAALNNDNSAVSFNASTLPDSTDGSSSQSIPGLPPIIGISGGAESQTFRRSLELGEQIGRLIAKRSLRCILLTGGEMPVVKSDKIQSAPLWGLADEALSRNVQGRYISLPRHDGEPVPPTLKRGQSMSGLTFVDQKDPGKSRRNILVGTVPDVLIVFPGGGGTLSEVGFAIEAERPIIFVNALSMWDTMADTRRAEDLEECRRIICTHFGVAKADSLVRVLEDLPVYSKSVTISIPPECSDDLIAAVAGRIIDLALELAAQDGHRGKYPGQLTGLEQFRLQFEQLIGQL